MWDACSNVSIPKLERIVIVHCSPPPQTKKKKKAKHKVAHVVSVCYTSVVIMCEDYRDTTNSNHAKRYPKCSTYVNSTIVRNGLFSCCVLNCDQKWMLEMTYIYDVLLNRGSLCRWQAAFNSKRVKTSGICSDWMNVTISCKTYALSHGITNMPKNICPAYIHQQESGQQFSDSMDSESEQVTQCP